METECLTETDRRGRTRASAALLLVGTAAFWGSMLLPAMGDAGGGGTDGFQMDGLSGWVCAIYHAPTYATNVTLALSFVAWGAAAWFRSPWWQWFGRIGTGAAVVVHALCGAWPGYMDELRIGYWAWLGASVALFLAFVVLPTPVRPPPGERLSSAEIDRGRRGIAIGMAAWASVALLVMEILLVAERSATPAPPSAGFALLWPLLFVAAVRHGHRAWRWAGAAGCAGAFGADAMWMNLRGPPRSEFLEGPWNLVWFAVPLVFVAAFLVLPPRRAVPDSIDRT